MTTSWDGDPTFVDDVEAYCARSSYAPGEDVVLHLSARTDHIALTVERWGATRELVYEQAGIPAAYIAPPADADANGCGWPEGYRFSVGEDWTSGFYLITLTAEGAPAETSTAHASFVVRAGSDPTQRAAALLVLATNTWNAYNTWGGASLYTGGKQVSFARPMARGALDREASERDDRKARPVRWGEEPDVDGESFQAFRLPRKYPPIIGSSGWYLYERRFVEWAEAEGYRFDFATSADLDEDPSIAEGYDLLIGIGHDEYWSGSQRAVVEDHVGRGGNYVSFSGNTMFWQVRIEPGFNSGDTMVCHKYSAHKTDPIMADDPQQMSGMWADPVVGRPEASFLGGGSAWGLYSRFGQATRRGSGAFTVYRHDHWLFEGTDLGYGDLLGAKHGAVGYETLGCRIQFDDFQLPVRAGGDDTPEDMEIVAFTPASNCGMGEYPSSISALSDQGDLEFIAERIHGDLSPESLAKARYGNAIMAVVRPFGPDGGQVVTIGSTDWVFGLPDDEAVAQVTRNALKRSLPDG